MSAEQYAAARPRPAASHGVRPASHLSELRFLLFGRAIPAVLFGFLARLVWQEQVAPALHAWSGRPLDAFVHLGPAVTYLVFCSLPALIYLTRPRPVASDTRWVVRATGLGRVR